MQSLAPFPGVHNVALRFLYGKLNKLTPFMNLSPQAISSPFCCFLTVAVLPFSLPAEEEPWGYAENRIRYSNMCMRSPTSCCVFRGQPTPSFSAGNSVFAGFSDISDTGCMWVRAQEGIWALSYHYVCMIMCFEICSQLEEILIRLRHKLFSPRMALGAVLLSYSQQPIDLTTEQRAMNINKQAEGNTGDHTKRQNNLMGLALRKQRFLSFSAFLLFLLSFCVKATRSYKVCFHVLV